MLTYKCGICGAVGSNSDIPFQAPMCCGQEKGVVQIETESRNVGVMPDIQPYKSMITGEMITSRSTHRNHLKQHNCMEIGNEKVTPKPVTPPPGLREALERAAYSTK